MNKFYLSIIFNAIVFFGFTQKANLFTIPNQSASFLRMPSRATMVDGDAVFFNPANLPLLHNGVTVNINNQILNQRSLVTSDYGLYTEHPKEYPGNVKSFIFPSVFFNWNIDKTSFHGGFMIIGGAGGTEYTNLPVSDRGIADVPAAIASSDFVIAPGLQDLDAGFATSYSNISDYRFDFKNKGVGFSPGVQFGMAYKLNKYFSFGLDGRWAMQRVSAEGYVRDIEILPNTHNPNLNHWQTPGDYLRAIADDTEIENYNLVAGIYDELGGDRQINARQKGAGFTFIPSVLVKPTEKLFVALKYEHRMKVNLTTVVRDGADGGEQIDPYTGELRKVFIDGEEIRSDLPGSLTMGVGYQFNDKWRLNVGSRVLFIKSVDYGGREEFIDKNYYELEIASEYKINKKFEVSAGYTYNKAGVNYKYHNEVDFWIPGHSVGFGGRYNPTEALSLDLGFLVTRNVTQNYTYDNHVYANGETLAGKPANYDNTYTMKFEKSAFLVGLSATIKLKNDKKTTRFIEDDNVEN